jgi:hypothetical protein
MEEAADQLEAIAAGRSTGRLDTRSTIDERNREQAERSRGLSPDEVVSSTDAARARMRAALVVLDAITPEAIEWFEESGALHHRTHAEHLRAWAARLHGSEGDRP